MKNKIGKKKTFTKVQECDKMNMTIEQIIEDVKRKMVKNGR